MTAFPYSDKAAHVEEMLDAKNLEEREPKVIYNFLPK
jgi:hypothetical protein